MNSRLHEAIFPSEMPIEQKELYTPHESMALLYVSKSGTSEPFSFLTISFEEGNWGK